MNKAMKKLTYLLAAAAVFAACNSGNKGYTVTGTVEGAADGDTVYLQTAEGRQLVKLDSAVITNGTFTFKGTQDSAVNRYITCQPSGKESVLMDFFLENGAINIKLTSGEGDSATGTANNDIYQRQDQVTPHYFPFLLLLADSGAGAERPPGPFRYLKNSEFGSSTSTSLRSRKLAR